MKIKQIIYFILIAAGAVIMAFADSFAVKEYALAIGIVLLMFGVYKTSVLWKDKKDEATDLDS